MPSDAAICKWSQVLKKAFIFFLPGATFIALFAAGYQFQYAQTQETLIDSQQAHLLEQAEQIIGDTLHLLVSDMAFLSREGEVFELARLPHQPTGDPLIDIEREFFSFSVSRGIYDQVRLIRSDGMEWVRVDYRNGHPALVARPQLQNKKDRYYFKNTIALKDGQFYLSPLDLNIEHGQVETPFKPMLRIATPIRRADGQPVGMVILNYLAADLLGKLRALQTEATTRLMLVNQDGYFLLGPRPDSEWGSMLADRHDARFQKTFPDAWTHAASNRTDRFTTPRGRFTHCTYYPLQRHQGQGHAGHGLMSGRPEPRIHPGQAVADEYWKIVVWTAPQQLAALQYRKLPTILAAAGIAMALIAVPAWLMGWTWCRRDTAERRRREVEQRYQDLYENAPYAYLTLDTNDGRITNANAQATRLTGYDHHCLTGMRLENLFDSPRQYQALVQAPVGRSENSGPVHSRDVQLRHADGSAIWAGMSIGTGDKSDELRVVLMDIAQRRGLEDQLRQAQKMEAMGTLAGGIAHDFNNILATMIGYTELVQDALPTESDEHDDLAEILVAGQRARDLVMQILTFSRQKEGEKRPLRIDPIVKEALKLLKASLPASIEIRQQIGKGIGVVMADPTQIHQIVMNLCTNAGHAMKKTGGILDVRLDQIDVDEGPPPVTEDLKPGRYLRLVVGDTGCGMTPDTLKRIFDPYFSTKSKEEGTGLGLAVLHGIVQAHSGAVTVSSTPGKGTVFEVFLPVSEKGAVSEQEVSTTVPTGTERILFVDDEAPLVKMETRGLESLGYRVTGRTSSIEALAAFRANPAAFDLVITDLTMPNMSGELLARQMVAIRPDIPVILCTGYSEQIPESRRQAAGIQAVLTKPLVRSQMTQAIRKALNIRKKTS